MGIFGIQGGIIASSRTEIHTRILLQRRQQFQEGCVDFVNDCQCLLWYFHFLRVGLADLTNRLLERPVWNKSVQQRLSRYNHIQTKERVLNAAFINNSVTKQTNTLKGNSGLNRAQARLRIPILRISYYRYILWPNS